MRRIPVPTKQQALKAGIRPDIHERFVRIVAIASDRQRQLETTIWSAAVPRDVDGASWDNVVRAASGD